MEFLYDDALREYIVARYGVGAMEMTTAEIFEDLKGSGIPEELYTPIFALARITGWSAHRIEELVGMGKILRPAYMSVMKRLE